MRILDEERGQPGKEALDFLEWSEPTQSFKVGQGNGNLRLVVGVLVHLHKPNILSGDSVASTDVANSKKATTSKACSRRSECLGGTVPSL